MNELSDYVATVARWALSALGAIALWVVRDLHFRLATIERQYVGREEMDRHIQRLEDKLDRVPDKLDTKADK